MIEIPESFKHYCTDDLQNSISIGCISFMSLVLNKIRFEMVLSRFQRLNTMIYITKVDERLLFVVRIQADEPISLVVDWERNKLNNYKIDQPDKKQHIATLCSGCFRAYYFYCSAFCC